MAFLLVRFAFFQDWCRHHRMRRPRAIDTNSPCAFAAFARAYDDSQSPLLLVVKNHIAPRRPRQPFRIASPPHESFPRRDRGIVLSSSSSLPHRLNCRYRSRSHLRRVFVPALCMPAYQPLCFLFIALPTFSKLMQLFVAIYVSGRTSRDHNPARGESPRADIVGSL